MPKQSRQNVFARTGYQISDHVQLFVQGSYARAVANDGTVDYLNYFTIQPDNAFIPVSIASKVTAPFTLGIFPRTSARSGFIAANFRSWSGRRERRF